MKLLVSIAVAAVVGLLGAGQAQAAAIYWSLFNAEGENAASAVYVTYGSLTDMLADTNRTGGGFPNGAGFGANIVGTGSDGTTYWSLFNAEGENAASAVYVTYGSLTDMLADTNRTGGGFPNGAGFGANIVGTGSDGTTYWSLFNAEGENAASAVYVTYGSLTDMLADTNRTGGGFPNGAGFGANIVGTGSDGTTYWSLFNAEGENAASAVYVTYASLTDMLADTNRTGGGFPNGAGFGANIVGSGAVPMRSGVTVPEPGSLALLAIGFAGLAASRRCVR